MLARGSWIGSIAGFKVGLGAEEDHRVEAATGSSSEFRSTPFGLHQFLDDGKAKPTAAELTTFVGCSPESIEGSLSLFITKAWAFVDDVNCDDRS